MLSPKLLGYEKFHLGIFHRHVFDDFRSRKLPQAPLHPGAARVRGYGRACCDNVQQMSDPFFFSHKNFAGKKKDRHASVPDGYNSSIFMLLLITNTNGS